MKLEELTDEQLRAEARRRGFELHSGQFSQAAQSALRELEGLRKGRKLSQISDSGRPS
jgi:hypothetical protein